MNKLFWIILMMLAGLNTLGQKVTNSLTIPQPLTDSLNIVRADSFPLSLKEPQLLLQIKDTHNLQADQMLYHPFWTLPSPVENPVQVLFVRPVSDWLFYLIAGLLLLLGILKMVFPRFFSDMFRLFFNTTLKQLQVRERLLQAYLPSFLYNLFFVFSAGIYLYLVMIQLGTTSVNNQWMMLSLTLLFIAGVYLTKYVILKFSGWLFGMEEVTDLYIFIVALINKLMGIFLLPFIVLMAWARNTDIRHLLPLSFGLIILFFVARFIRSYASLRTQLKMGMFHFFLYLLCFEVIPLAVIYKGLLIYIKGTA